MEGVVIKPVDRDLINYVPAFKVRTNNYLQLIYGINFNKDFDIHFRNRDVKMKMNQSIKSHEIDRMLLRIPHNKLLKSNKKYVDLLYKAIQEENLTNTLSNLL